MIKLFVTMETSTISQCNLRCLKSKVQVAPSSALWRVVFNAQWSLVPVNSTTESDAFLSSPCQTEANTLKQYQNHHFCCQILPVIGRLYLPQSAVLSFCSSKSEDDDSPSIRHCVHWNTGHRVWEQGWGVWAWGVLGCYVTSPCDDLRFTMATKRAKRNPQ